MILKRKTEKTSRSHKVSEIVRKAISEVLVKNELPLDTPFEFPINVVKVEMNSDLKIAYVYDKINDTETILKLNSCKQYLSREVATLIDLKFSPKLVFRNDKSINEITNIEKLLRSEKVLNDSKRN